MHPYWRLSGGFRSTQIYNIIDRAKTVFILIKTFSISWKLLVLDEFFFTFGPRTLAKEEEKTKIESEKSRFC